MEKVTKTNKKNGEILLGFRKQNKLTQSELAKIIGRDEKAISKYEKGYRTIPQNSIDLLNKKYHLHLVSTNHVCKVTKKSKEVDIKTAKALSSKTKTSVKKAVNVVKSTDSAKTVKATAKAIKKTVSKKETKKSFRTKISEAVSSLGTIKGSNFGKRIAWLRKSLNLTASAFSEQFSFNPTTLSRIESNKTTNVSVASLKALNKAGVNIVELIK